ncbi:MAG: Ig-like domain-containing protein [Rhodospirillaceae bacterium]|nr:Ig-like domain-containing protein [Rhodospirillaceae bacterium]
MARYAIYLAVTALLFGGGAWLWLSRQAPAPQPAPVAATAPSPPAPQPEPAPAQPVNPSFDVVRVAPDGRTVLAGRAAPGAEVTVRTEDAVIGAATADKRGEWVLLPEAPLQPGTRELSLSASEAGGAARDSDSTVVMLVPERPDGRAAAASPLAVLLPKEGDGDSRVLQAPAPQGDVTAAKGLSIDAVDFDAKGLIRPSGKAAPGTELRLYLDNRPLGVATADARGQWSLRSTDPAPSGQHSLRVDQLGPDGQIAARVEVPFTRAAPSLGAAKPGQLVVQSGNSLWRIARRTYGAGDRYTVIYQANKELIRDANKIYPGQVLAVPRR